MTYLSDKIQRMKASPTIAVTTKAAELRAEGKDVIGLGSGEPDFDTPEHVKQAAIEAMKAGQTKYTPVGGTPALKQAIAAKFKRENGLEYKPEEIMAGTGAKQLIFNALLAGVNDGDEVIIPAPYWVSYPDMVEFAGGVPVIVACEAQDGFKMTPQALEAAITKKTRWLILNSPSNPTGAVYSAAELRELAQVLEGHPQVMVMSDDIYEHLVYDGEEFATIAQVAPQLKDRTLVLNGVSKAYAMTGWRIGYAAGPADLIKAMTKVQSQSTSNPCSISQAATIGALEGDQSFLAEWRSVFARRRDMVVKRLNAMDGLTCDTPKGAFYVYPSCDGLIGATTPAGAVLHDSGDVTAYLLEEALVAAVPGTAFGLDPHFRISYATSDEALEKACDRMEAAIGKLQLAARKAS